MPEPHHPDGDINRFVRRDGEMLVAMQVVDKASDHCTHCDLKTSKVGAGMGCTSAHCGAYGRPDNKFVAFMTQANAIEARLLGTAVPP